MSALSCELWRWSRMIDQLSLLTWSLLTCRVWRRQSCMKPLWTVLDWLSVWRPESTLDHQHLNTPDKPAKSAFQLSPWFCHLHLNCLLLPCIRPFTLAHNLHLVPCIACYPTLNLLPVTFDWVYTSWDDCYPWLDVYLLIIDTCDSLHLNVFYL